MDLKDIPEEELHKIIENLPPKDRRLLHKGMREMFIKEGFVIFSPDMLIEFLNTLDDKTKLELYDKIMAWAFSE